MAGLFDDLSAGQYQKVARGLLGPAYEPLAALPGLLGEFSPGADVRDYQNYASSALQKALSGDYGQAGSDALWAGAALAGVALPGHASMLDARKRRAAQKYDPNTWYHGTAADFTEFDPARHGESVGAAYLGKDEGVWLSSDPRDASFFAAHAARRKGGEGANVMPLTFRGERVTTMDFSKAGDITPKEMYATISVGIEDYSRRKGARPDAVILRDVFSTLGGKPHRHDIAMIADPEKLRSIFARFDPEKKGLRNILSGLAAAGLLVPLAGGHDVAESEPRS
jgi:hypothetical protein